jgi:hypothetical protein
VTESPVAAAGEDLTPSRYAGWSDAEIYIDLCNAIIDTIFVPEHSSRQGMREWWMAEAEHRREYRVTKAQAATMLERCRVVAMTLPETQPHDQPPAPVLEKKAKHKPKRRGAAV